MLTTRVSALALLVAVSQPALASRLTSCDAPPPQHRPRESRQLLSSRLLASAESQPLPPPPELQQLRLQQRLQRLRGGTTASVLDSFAPWLRVLRRFLFPGNPPRTRAPPAPPPPPKAPAAAAEAAASDDFNRAGSKGKGRRGTATASVGSVHSVHSKAEFDKLVSSARAKQLVVVDFAASWCGPCQQIAPKFAAMAAAMPHVRFLKVDVDECKDLSQQFGVQSMPTFKLLRGGKEVGEMKGADEGALREKVEGLAGPADRWSSAGSGKTLR